MPSLSSGFILRNVENSRGRLTSCNRNISVLKKRKKQKQILMENDRLARTVTRARKFAAQAFRFRPGKNRIDDPVENRGAYGPLSRFGDALITCDTRNVNVGEC